MSPAPLADYAAVTDYLFALKSGGVKFGVDRMALLSAALGHPERAYPVVHVAGTNGKGSVSAMLERIFRAAGLRTGLYTSPHLVKLGERVQVDRRPLTDREVVVGVNELLPVAARVAPPGSDEHPTFFEFMTALAFRQFARSQVDVAVVEVGLGGRLDATNVVEPALTVITSIGLDHTEYLGETLAKIAAEKAGIIKPGVPLVLGRVPPEAEAVIRAVAAGRGATVVSVREEFGEEIDRYPETSLAGDYQRWNAATATLAARAFRKGRAIAEETIAGALVEVDWPGRWQRVEFDGRTLILDASHNPEGAAVLDANLTQLVSLTGRRPIAVAGVLGAARAKALLAVLARHVDELHLIQPKQARACTLEEMEEHAPDDLRPRLRRASVESVFPTAHRCGIGAPGAVIVVTGSIYLLGEIFARLRPQLGADEGRLQDF